MIRYDPSVSVSLGTVDSVCSNLYFPLSLGRLHSSRFAPGNGTARLVFRAGIRLARSGI